MAIVNLPAATTISLGMSVRFDGSKSYDPEGGQLTYLWSWNTVRIPEPTFELTFNALGTTEWTLTVTDDQGDITRTKVLITVNDDKKPPVAKFTPATNISVVSGTTVTFDGSASYDPDGGSLRYLWKGAGYTSTAVKFDRKFTDIGTTAVELIVTDDENIAHSRSITVTVTEGNRPPNATFSPGSDQTITAGDALTFDGSASSDPDGDRLTYTWTTTQVNGVAGSGTSFSHRFKEPGSFGVQLVVSDPSGASAKKWIQVTVRPQNRPPTASFTPGSEQTITAGDALTFDGSASSDPDGDKLTYSWTTTQINGVAGTGTSFSHRFREPGAFGVQLVVSDPSGESSKQWIRVNVLPPNAAPVVDFSPGSTQVITPGTVLNFDGSRSFDPEGGALTYEWTTTQVPGVASNSKTFNYRFEKPGDFGVQLVVRDPQQVLAKKWIRIHVNQPPVVTFTPGTTQTVTPGTVLTFDGSGSYDPDGGPLTYEWTTSQVKGVAETSSKFSYRFKTPGAFGVQLVVRDQHQVLAKKWIQVVVNQPPVVKFTPGVTQSIKAGTVLTFDGSGSYDPEGGALTYVWTTSQVKGVAGSTNKFSYRFKTPGAFGVQLVVTDSSGASAKKWIRINVT